MATPPVSVVIPVLNEERHLAEVVAAVLAQDYAGGLEVILSIGPSTDRTSEIAAQLAAHNPMIRVVENVSGRTPDAMNAGIAVATGEVIVRCDGHALLPQKYVATAVETLQRTGAVSTGGVMAAKGDTPFQQAVAWAMTSKVGVGAASFHVGGQEGPAETVYLGCFNAAKLREVGGYDPRMTRAQDWELHHRLIEAGGLVWFNPALQVTYKPRRTLRSLSSQYRQYGQWRRKVMQLHPETRRRISALRYFAPPAVLIASVLGLMLGLIGIVTSSVLQYAALVPLGYLATLLAVGLYSFLELSLPAALLLPLVIATMHMSWGWGFLTSNSPLTDEPGL